MLATGPAGKRIRAAGGMRVRQAGWLRVCGRVCGAGWVVPAQAQATATTIGSRLATHGANLTATSPL